VLKQHHHVPEKFALPRVGRNKTEQDSVFRLFWYRTCLRNLDRLTYEQ